MEGFNELPFKIRLHIADNTTSSDGLKYGLVKFAIDNGCAVERRGYVGKCYFCFNVDKEVIGKGETISQAIINYIQKAHK